MNAVVAEMGEPERPEDRTLLAMISRAAHDPETDVEKLERLMMMYERIEAKRAETAFNDAMMMALSKVGRIAADAVNSQTRSNYATYAKLDRVLRPIYTECGFSLSFDTGPDAPPDHVRVICYVSHKAGHSRTYHADLPADGKGAKGGDVMTKTHAFGSGVSYGMRYLLKMIFNAGFSARRRCANSCPVTVPGMTRSVKRSRIEPRLSSQTFNASSPFSASITV